MQKVPVFGKSDEEMMLHCALVRGEVINAMTVLERTIDIFISHHFSATIKNSEELMNCVFATKYITFENKRMIFQYLLETHHKEYRDKNFKDIHARLDEFNKHRNALAHYVVDASPEAINHYKKTNEITFLKFEKSIEKERYSWKSSQAIATRIFEFVLPVSKIIKPLRAE